MTCPISGILISTGSSLPRCAWTRLLFESVVRARTPIELDVFLDESRQLYCVENALIGISTCSSTREGLFDEVESQLAMLWQEYALASDGELDGPAPAMKQALLERFVEIADAS